MLDMPGKDELVKLCEKRVTIKELAERYFVGTTTIDRWIRFYRISKAGLGFKKGTLEELINTDLTKNKIAKNLGCNIKTLNTYLDKYGLQRVAK